MLSVFLSHSSKDKPFVRELADFLRRDGDIEVWLDEHEIAPGEKIVDRIGEGLASDFIWLVLSPDSVDSAWVKEEWTDAFWEQTNKRKLGLKKLAAFLKRHRRVGIDSSIFIYQSEGNPRHAELADTVFQAVAGPLHTAIASTVTMAELLVQPYRNADLERVNQYYALLATYPNLLWIAPDLEIADLAAKFPGRVPAPHARCHPGGHGREGSGRRLGNQRRCF
jgi:hypothetical protein